MAQPAKTQITAAEFRQLPETNKFVELINGEVIVSPSLTDRHQDIIVNLILFLNKHMPNGKVVVAPMDVYLDDVNVFQPDVFWLAKDSQCVSRDGYYYGAPELTVEVHSPATSSRDKREKFEQYEAHGVLEYWMVDPVGNHIEVWRRDADAGQFTRSGIFKHGESFDSFALGKTITLESIFP